MVGAPSIGLTQMNRVLVIRRGRTRSRTDALDIGRPPDEEGLRSPYGLKQFAVGRLRQTVSKTRGVRQAHFDGVGGRALRLFRAGILQTIAAGTHVPEISPNKVAP